MTINIKNIDKEDLLLTLYNNAKPKGMGFLHYTNKPMTKEEAREILGQKCEADSCFIDLYFIKISTFCSDSDFLNKVITKIPGACSFKYLDFDYLKGRVIKTDISRDEINLWHYKRENTHVDIEKIISNLKNSGASDSTKASFRPTNPTEYNAFFAKKLGDLHKNGDLLSASIEDHLLQKCKNQNYNYEYTRAKLIDIDLYPWEWNDPTAVNALCAILINFWEL